MTFQEAKTFADLFYEEYKISGRDLNAICNSIPKTSMGLTSPEVKVTEEYKAATIRFNIAHAKLQDFNKSYVKLFKKEIAEDRATRRNSFVE